MSAPPEPEASPPRGAVDHATWAARFGWAVGGALGLVAGFACALALELGPLRAAANPTQAAARASGVLVPALFVLGALAGYAFGARGGVWRYRALGASTGLAALLLLFLARAFAR